MGQVIKIRLEQPHNAPNFCFEVRRVSRSSIEREETAFFQSDWDYPGLAMTFGWSIGCKCGTDGTVDCVHKTAGEHIASAYDYLVANIGKVAEDPGYLG